MRFGRALLLFVFVPLSLAGCGGGGDSGIPAISASVLPAAASPPLSSAQLARIVFIGDSITELGGGTGGYVWQIDRVLHALYPDASITVINAGVSGEAAFEMGRRFRGDVLDRSPTLIVVSAGVNDVRNGVPVDEFIARVRAMVDMARERDVPVVLFTPTLDESGPEETYNPRLKEYAAALRDLGARLGLRVADQTLAFGAYGERFPDDRLTRDSLHMNRTGDTLMARVALLAFGIPNASIDAAIAQINR